MGITEMKTEKEIRNEMVRLREELTIVQRKHSALNQIDTLSGEGSQLRAKENFILGQLGFATWIINK
jgi:hypothetical protein